MWYSEEFVAGHVGYAVPVLADGTDAPPIERSYTRQAHTVLGKPGEVETWAECYWWLYDGKEGRPRAVAIRPTCECGWEGPRAFPVDHDDRDGTEGDKTTGPYGAWHAHLDGGQG
ncbi:hypothetical protein ACFY7C_37470 [Streptomyces sp. NPDC012769]|uniref:hypothetical protein n=1 Tax=Streptomyces sp. NPDC012769 TaxID=3364848 RepID=UPI0036AF8569